MGKSTTSATTPLLPSARAVPRLPTHPSCETWCKLRRSPWWCKIPLSTVRDGWNTERSNWSVVIKSFWNFTNHSLICSKESRNEEGRPQEGRRQEARRQEGCCQEGRPQEGRRQEGRQEARRQEGRCQEGCCQEVNTLRANTQTSCLHCLFSLNFQSTFCLEHIL